MWIRKVLRAKIFSGNSLKPSQEFKEIPYEDKFGSEAEN
jgi:hypothetical protein